MKHTIGIEPDESPLPKDHMAFKVVIRRKDGEVVGVPLRNVSDALAKEMMGPIRYAFGYGVDAARWITGRACQHIELLDAPEVIKMKKAKSRTPKE